MSVRSKARAVRRAEKRAVRVQRRLWLAQVAFWPVVVIVVGSAAVLVVVRRRNSTVLPVHTSADVDPAPGHSEG